MGYFSNFASISKDIQENKKAIIGGLGGAAAGGLIASAFKASTAGIVGGALLEQATKMLKSLLVSERLNQGEHDQDKDKNDRQS